MAKKQAPQSPPDPDAKPVSSRRLKPVIMVGLIVLLAVCLSVAGTWLLFRKDSAAPETTPAESVEETAPARQPALYEPLTPAFVVNFDHQGRQRYLQVSMALMGRDAERMNTLKVHMPVLRNRLVLLLGRQDFELLMTPAGKEALRQQITADVQELAQKEVGGPTVEQVLFTNFVLQ